MTTTASKATKEDIERQRAARFLLDRAYLAVLGAPQMPKLRQIVKSLDIKGVSPRLLRHVMAESDKFETVDRRWASAARFGDSRRPVEQVLTNLLAQAGIPVPADVLARELAAVYGRPVEHFENLVPRFLADREQFFEVEGVGYGLVSWLLKTESEEEADVIYDNFLEDEDIQQFSEACSTVKWRPDKIADCAVEVVETCKEPIPLKVLAFFAWRGLQVDFDPYEFYCSVLADDRLFVMSDQRVYPASAEKKFLKTLEKMAKEVEALPAEPDEEELEGPIAVTDTDKEEIIALILERGTASAEELLEAVLEITPEDPAYPGTLENLEKALEGEQNIMWMGAGRWGKVQTFPDEVKVVPEPLVIPEVVPFETPEGEVFDQEIEEDGFEGDLKSAVYNPLAEDVGDEDPARTLYQPTGDSQRCVLKYHHRMAGTFPLCQINPEFFGTEPEIIPIVLIDEGKRKQAYVNNATRLIYGLKDFYKDVTDISGTVFYIDKTANPGEYRIRFEGEVDEDLGIDTNRSVELLELKGKFESQEMPIFDVVRAICEQRSQGVSFVRLVNEVGIVRRCSRLLVASILSSYHCFHTRGKKALWQFDAKKASQGFIKSKRKYIKK